MKTCAVCGYEGEESNVMTAPCRDSYCRGCVNELFDRAARHEVNFPPTCCGRVVTLEDAKMFLSTEIYDKFQENFEEFSTTNRTYCFDPKCRTFISPKAVHDDKATCPACKKLTCITCKAEAHEGDCPDDTVCTFPDEIFLMDYSTSRKTCSQRKRLPKTSFKCLIAQTSSVKKRC